MGTDKGSAHKLQVGDCTEAGGRGGGLWSSSKGRDWLGSPVLGDCSVFLYVPSTLDTPGTFMELQPTYRSFVHPV